MHLAAAPPGPTGLVQTHVALPPARLYKPDRLAASIAKRSLHRSSQQRFNSAAAATPAAAAAGGAAAMADDGLRTLQDFQLTMPDGADPEAPLVVSGPLECWARCRRQDCACRNCAATVLGASCPFNTPQSHRPSRPALQVLLGWYGCLDKHLAKYASLLEREGYPLLRGILPGHAVFSPFAFPRRRWAARLLDAVAAVDPAGRRPLVFYAFSNGELVQLAKASTPACIAPLATSQRHLRALGAGPCLPAWGPTALPPLPCAHDRRWLCSGAAGPAGTGGTTVPHLCGPHRRTCVGLGSVLHVAASRCHCHRLGAALAAARAGRAAFPAVGCGWAGRGSRRCKRCTQEGRACRGCEGGAAHSSCPSQLAMPPADLLCAVLLMAPLEPRRPWVYWCASLQAVLSGEGPMLDGLCACAHAPPAHVACVPQLPSRPALRRACLRRRHTPLAQAQHAAAAARPAQPLPLLTR